MFAELGLDAVSRGIRILKVCGFGDMRASHMAIRRHTLAIGRELRPNGLTRRTEKPSRRRDRQVLGSWYRRHLCKASRALGCTTIPSNGGPRRARWRAWGAIRLCFVQSGLDREFLRRFLLQQGMKRNTVMRVVTAGDDGLRNFVQRSSPRPMESQLDWFHIGMKLELLRKAVVMPVTYQEYLEDPHAFDPVQRRVSRLRDALWRGRSWPALLQFAWMRGDVDRWAAEHPGPLR